jgi:succinoglycan biosynthesis protein ExoA
MAVTQTAPGALQGSQRAAPNVTVLLPVLNEEHLVAGSLRSVLHQDYPPDRLEVLVLDGGSTDRTTEEVRRLAEGDRRVRVVDNPAGTRAAGLNRGVREGRGEVFLIAEARSRLPADYVRRVIDLLERTGAGNVGGATATEAETYVGRLGAAALASPFGMGGARFRHSSRGGSTDTVYLGAFKRRVLEAVGPFSEDLPGNVDYEFNYRIRRAGFDVVFDPSIRVGYRTRERASDLLRQQFRYGTWKAQMVRRHPRSVRLRHLVAPAFVSSLAVLAAAAPVLPAARLGLVLVGVSYGAAAVTASVAAAARSGWGLLPGLPATFLGIHLAWGTGFLSSTSRSLGRAARPA